MMVVFWMWSTDSRASVRSHGWLEQARRATVAPGAAVAGADLDDDDDQLAAYNACLRRFTEKRSG